MASWQAGIVVVASAGNTGPEPMSIGVPGNLPYVITVGAMTDNYTPDDPSDDAIANFSSSGPSVEGFVKPEMVAPGGHILGSMSWSERLAQAHEAFFDSGLSYFTMSGTSSKGRCDGISAVIISAPYAAI